MTRRRAIFKIKFYLKKVKSERKKGRGGEVGLIFEITTISTIKKIPMQT
jgi:hypothetical protein